MDIQHIVKFSADLCGAYSDFSRAVTGLIYGKLRDYCQAFGVNDTAGLGFSFTPLGSSKEDGYNVFLLKIWQMPQHENQEPIPPPDVKQPTPVLR